MGNQKNTQRRKKKPKKLKGNAMIKHQVHEIESRHYQNLKLDIKARITLILDELRVFQTKVPKNIIINHAIVKWTDKLGRNGSSTQEERETWLPKGEPLKLEIPDFSEDM